MNSNQNKQMLWELLKDNNAFNNYTNKDYENVIVLFNESVNLINNKTPNLSLMEKNKIFIQDIMKKLNSVKKKKINIFEDNYVLTHEEIQNVRRNDFEEKLKNTQEDVNKAMKLERPPDIDFSDKNDDESIHNIESLIENKIKERSYDQSIHINNNSTSNHKENDNKSNENQLETIEIKKTDSETSIETNANVIVGTTTEIKMKNIADETQEEITEQKKKIETVVTNDIHDLKSLHKRITELEKNQSKLLEIISEHFDINIDITV